MAVAIAVASGAVIQPNSPLPAYTATTMPTATDNKNRIALVTNGNAGLSCLAVCDGVDWWPITIGTTHVAAS